MESDPSERLGLLYRTAMDLIPYLIGLRVGKT